MSTIINIPANGSLTPGGAVPGTAAILAQPNWYIDPNNGVDSNDGTTAATALKTVAEWAARLGVGGVLAHGALTIYGGSTTTVGNACTALHTGTLTSVTNVTASSNTQTQATDVTLSSWASYIGYRGRVTSVTDNNKIFFPCKDLGGGAARFGTPQAGPSFFTATTLTGGDTYQIDQQITVTIGALDHFIAGNAGAGATSVFVLGNLPSTDPLVIPHVGLTSCFIQDLDITFPSSWGPSISLIRFVACRFAHAAGGPNFNGSVTQLAGSVVNNDVSFSSARGNILGGLVLGNVFVLNGGLVQVRNGATFQGGGLICQYGEINVSDGNVGVFDVPTVVGSNPVGSAIKVGAGQNITSFGFLTVALAQNLYGSGSAGYGIEVMPGCMGMMNTISGAPNITGSLGAFSLGASTTACRAWNESTGAWTSPISASWANFEATIGNGGFGQNAHNVGTRSSLVWST